MLEGRTLDRDPRRPGQDREGVQMDFASGSPATRVSSAWSIDVVAASWPAPLVRWSVCPIEPLIKHHEDIFLWTVHNAQLARVPLVPHFESLINRTSTNALLIDIQ